MFRRNLLSPVLAGRGLGTSTSMRASSATLFTGRKLAASRTFTSSISRPQQQQQQNQQPQQHQQAEQPNSFKDGMSAFRPFGSPFLKVFLGAIFTYQIIYYAWKKLETNEKKLLKNKEIKALETQAKELAAANAK